MTDQSPLEYRLITVQALVLTTNDSSSHIVTVSLSSFLYAGKFNNSETFARYKLQKVFLAPPHSSPPISSSFPFPSCSSSATTIIRKTFEGTKVRTFVPSFSSLCLSLSLFSSFLLSSPRIEVLCLRSDAPTVFCSLCLSSC